MLEVNGTELYHEVRGAGPSVLLSMGATGDAGHFERLAELLADGFTVVTYDRRGSGRSPRPPGWAATSAEEQADDAAALLEALGLAPAVVFGTSLAGVIAVCLVLRHPRVVSGAILHEPAFWSLFDDPEEVKRTIGAEITDGMRSGGPREAIERFYRFVAGDANWEGLDRELRERIRASAGTWDVEPVRVADRDAPARPGVTQAPRDVRALLRRNELTGLPRRQRHCPFVAAGGLRRGLPLRLAAGPEEKSSRLVLSGAVARVAGRSDGSTLGSMTSGFADRDLAVFIDDLNAQRLPSAAEAGPAALRQAAEQRAAARPRGPEMHVVRDLFAPPGGRPARLYRPTPRATPLVLYLHGGGWVIGDLETHDRACRRLAFSSGVSVLALDYRRAPEHPWPAAVDDAVTTLRWLASHPSELEMAPTAVAIAGDSAGGTIAALACVRMRDEAPEALPSVQALICANTDLGNSGASIHEKGHGFGLDVADIEWFNSQWVPDPSILTDPRVSPLFVPDLSGLPAAIVITCEHDPLRDEGEAYAARLEKAGVTVTARRE